MLTDQELQTLRNMGNEAERAADELDRLRERAAYLDEQRTRLAIAIDDYDSKIDRLRVERDALRGLLERAADMLDHNLGLRQEIERALTPNAK